MDMEKIAARSSLITSDLETQLQGILAKLTEEACLICILDPAQKESLEMGALVRHIASLSEHLSCCFYSASEAKEAAPELDLSLLPVTALYKQGHYTGIAFHGVTGGKEMNSLVLALYNVAGPAQEISKKLLKKINKLTHKNEIKIFVSLSCHHCAQQVIACQRLAAESEQIEARMIDARLYPHLVEQYKIERIPMTVINEKETLLGVKDMEQIYEILKSYE